MRKTLPAILLLACVMASSNAGAIDLSKKAPAAAKAVAKAAENLPLFVPEMSYKGEPNLAGELFVAELSFKGVIDIPRMPEKTAPPSATTGLGSKDLGIKNAPANFGKLPSSSAQRAPARSLRPVSPRPPTRGAAPGAGMTGAAAGVEMPVENYKP